jgi:putative N-acetyltransferase (TIGR04045 family)
VRFASQAWELAGAAALRHAVFCKEQRVFAHDDRDAIDDIAIPIIALSMIGGQPDEVVGTVRIHRETGHHWWGSRLAVAASHRTVGSIGPALSSASQFRRRARAAACVFRPMYKVATSCCFAGCAGTASPRSICMGCPMR